MIKENGKIISLLLRDVNRKEWQSVDKELNDISSVTSQQAMVLKMISEKPGLIQKDIVISMHRKAATISSFLKNLEKNELIIRKIPSNNNRNKEIYLTEKGRSIVTVFEQIIKTAEKKLVDSMSLDQQENLIQLLKLINNELDK